MSSGATVFFGGDIVPMDDPSAAPEALAVRDGMILAVGSLRDVEAAAGAGADRVDLQGKALLPGFVEPHTHPALVALLQGSPIVDVRAGSVPTFAAVLEKIKRKVAKAEPGEFLYFLGLDPQLHEDLEVPSLEELDRLAPDNPLALQTSNLHTLYCNSKAIEAAGLTDDSEEPVGGHFGRDEAGRLNGVFIESKAEVLITGAAMKSWGPERSQKSFEEAIWANVRAGVTTVAELIYEPAYALFFEPLAAREDCPIRVRAYEQYNLSREPSAAPGGGSDRFKIIGIKMHADGSPFVGNIGTSRPYLNTDMTQVRMQLGPDHKGSLNLDREQLQEIVDRYAEQGWQIAVHTQGDRAIQNALDCFEKTIRRLNLNDHRFRLEHCALMTQAQIERARALNVMVSFFPNHIYFWGEAIRDNLFGNEIAERYMPIGDAARAGVCFSLHGDAPMTDTDPLGYVQVATTRRTLKGEVVGDGQRLSVFEALQAVTIHAARQLFLEQEIGTLTPGKRADLVILDKNPLVTDPEDIGSIPVHQTWFEGRPISMPEGFRS